MQLQKSKQKVYKLELQVLATKNKFTKASYPVDDEVIDSRFTIENVRKLKEQLRDIQRTKTLVMSQKVNRSMSSTQFIHKSF